MNEYLNYKELQKLSKEAVEKLQNLRFKATVRNLLPHTKFYKNLFSEFGADFFKIKTIYDWKKQGLPLIKKSTYMKKPEEFIVKPDKKKIFSNHLSFLKNQNKFGEIINLILNPEKKKIIKDYYTPKMILFSGGTESGTPTPVFMTAKEKENLMKILENIGQILIKNNFKNENNKNEMIVGMNLFPYGPHLAWHAVHHAIDISADLNLCTAAGGAIPTERLVMLAKKTKPNVLCGMNEYIRNKFLPESIKQKIKLPKKTIFVNGAQKMCEAEKKQIKEMAKKIGIKNCTILDFYGASELKEDILPECKPNSGFHHLAPLSNIIKTTKIEKADKELITEWDFAENGHATIWNIDGAGTLFQGYLLGDHYEKTIYGICPNCKLNTLKIKNISRIKDIQSQLKLTGMVEEKIKGTRVNLLKIRETALSEKGIKEAQVVLDKTGTTDKLKLYIVSENTTPINKLKQKFSASEIKPEIKKTTLEKIQGKKFKFEGIIIKNKEKQSKHSKN
jgi:phenylacetate-CoA ligase